jgi:hypothetical protein
MESERMADRFFSQIIDTVHRCESKSRRWKSHNTPNTSAPSAERRPSRDTLWESGTARHATRLSLEEHTPYRTSTIICWVWVDEGALNLIWHLNFDTYANNYLQNARRRCHAIDSPKIEGNCRGLDGLGWMCYGWHCWCLGTVGSHAEHELRRRFR